MTSVLDQLLNYVNAPASFCRASLFQSVPSTAEVSEEKPF